MAPRLLIVWLGGVALVAACPWPNEYTVVDDPVDSPPIIDVESILVEGADAPQDGVYTWDVALNTEFAVTLARVSDRDVDDRLYVRWLVGHDTASAALNVVRNEEEVLPSGGVDRRAGRFAVTEGMLEDVDRARAAAGQTVAGRTYLVEVLVGDRRPVFGGGPRDYPADARVARWQFVLRRVDTGGGG